MTTNYDRIAAYEAFKRKHAPERYLPRIDHRDDIWRIPLVLAFIVIAALCAYGVWQHEQIKPWAVQVAEECEASGKVPHVERAADWRVLGVRCDISTGKQE